MIDQLTEFFARAFQDPIMIILYLAAVLFLVSTAIRNAKKDKVYTAEELPQEAQVYFKKRGKKWIMIDSDIVNPITREINIRKALLGTKKTWFVLIAIIIIAGLFYVGVNDLISGYRDVAENPCAYCPLVKGLNADSNWVNANFTIIEDSNISSYGSDIG